MRKRDPYPLITDRKVIRFRRLIDNHTEVLDRIGDFKEKQSGEYILDRQYIEAQIDRIYDRVRQIIYDSTVICASDGEDQYDQIARFHQASEDLLKNLQRAETKLRDPKEEDVAEWEVLALRSIYQDLTRFQEKAPSSEPQQSLTELAGLAHEKAAAWLAKELPFLPLSPIAYLCREGDKSLLFEVFGLNGVLEAEPRLKELLCPVSLHDTIPTTTPLYYLIQGLAESGPRREAPSSLYVAGPREKIKPTGNPSPRLYMGDSFLMLWLPSPSPFSLFLCSLTGNKSENLFYLYGSSAPTPCARLFPFPFFTWKAPFTIYGYGLSKSWMLWATRFSWVQGEERLRLLGHMLGTRLASPTEASSKEQSEESLKQVLNIFHLTSVAPCDRIERESKDGTASSHNGC